MSTTIMEMRTIGASENVHSRLTFLRNKVHQDSIDNQTVQTQLSTWHTFLYIYIRSKDQMT